MANDRQELEDLRRLDELESKAAGGSVKPVTREELLTNHPVPDQPDTRTQQVENALSPVMGVPEALASMGTGALGSIAGPIAGVGAQLLTGANGPQVAQKVQSALTYEPRSSMGKKLVEGAGKVADELGLAGLGPTEQMALSGVTPRAPIIKGVNRVEDTIPSLKRTGGAAAKTVTDELQRQRNAIDAGKVGPTTGKPSPVESELAKVQGATGQFQEVLQNTPGDFNVDNALSQIDRHLKGTAIDKDERAALGRVKDAIDLAVKNSGGASKVDTFDGYVLKDGKLVKPAPGDTKKNTLPLSFVDNVRQVIKKEIDSKDASGKPLSKDTQRRLFDVQNALLSEVPDSYRKAIAGIADTRQGLEKFNPEQTGVGKVTSTEKGYQPLGPGEAQEKLGKIFAGDRKERDLKSFVDSTAHDPKAAQGLRQSYAEWLSKPDEVTKQVKSGDLLKRWESTREAVKSSGLMTEKHAADIDKVVGDIRKFAAGGHIRHGVTTTLGYLMGYHVGHGLRNIIRESSSVSPKNMRALESVLAKVAADPKAMDLLSAPPTRANFDRLKASAIDLAPFVIPQAARAQNPLGMQPAGL